jgi:hypothetical protein
VRHHGLNRHIYSNKFKKNPSLKPEISELEVLYEVSFGPAATKFVESLMKNLTCFSIAVRNEWGEIFVVMVELGFFCRTGDRYQMTIPQAISGLKVEAARFPIPCHPVPLSPTGCQQRVNLVSISRSIKTVAAESVRT